MKKSIYKITTFALAVVLLFTSCDKLSDFGHTNTNPGVTNTPNTAALLTNVLSGLANYSAHRGGALYCQYFSETQYPELSIYTTNLANVTMPAIYSGHLYDLENIIITNTDAATKVVAELNGANANQIAIARIMKTYIFWTITDRWGDVPYKTALKGNPSVSFERQESIYKGMITELTEAVAQFTTGAAIKGDIAYNGDIANWKKFANSMRMLMALRLSKVYPTSAGYAATEFKAALADAAGSIDENSENFKMVPPGGNFRNTFFNMYDGRKDYGESATMTTIMSNLSDSRQQVYGSTVLGVASSTGVPFGRVRTFIDPWCGSHPDWTYVMANAYRTETSPYYILTAGSVLLARAEAADRGWTSETANTKTLYEAGITASHTQWGIAAPSAGYLANASVALPGAFGTGANVSFINLQQYIAFYPDGIQGWSNWRRTNVPALTPAPDGTIIPLVIPRRYMYSTAEYSLNADSVKATIVRQFGAEDKDLMNSRIWWDK
ncbi:MAG: SusD/RagB family nutrient-binding outer membrane lipoprotein [Bacteroidia bacterium]|nr:SusD/RagB family nutrient-binding outer membrane lipoprotein [Bacteroidia bacterium]